MAALERGWSPDTLRAEAAREELERIAADPAGFVREQVDREAAGPPVTLPDGTKAARLPGYRRWIWDGDFCGVIGLRWQPGTEELPPYVLGHIGFSVVPWKQRRGYATRALRLLLNDAGAEGLRYVELTTKLENVPSQRVIEANGGRLVERFTPPGEYGQREALRFRIDLVGARFDLGQAVEILERTPSAFRALLGGLSAEWTTPNEGPDTFSAFDNLGHLVHGERTDWIPRARIILEHGRERPFDPFDRFAQYEESRGKHVGDLLDELERLRAENLATLRAWRLTPRELALEGEHPALGRVTLEQLLATWVVHDLGHLAQTARVMAKRYKETIGPWRAYLPIVDR